MIRVVTKHSIDDSVDDRPSHKLPWFYINMLAEKEDDIVSRVVKNEALAVALTALANNGKSQAIVTNSIEVAELTEGQ